MRNLYLTPDFIEEVIDRYPNPLKKVVKNMIKKYGPPDDITNGILIWHRENRYR